MTGGDRRAGVAAGVAAYSLWGIFPLFFHQLKAVDAAEILTHRVIWSFLAVCALLALRGNRRWFDQVRARPGGLARLAVAGVLIGGNWLTYVWAVNHDRVTEVALGYYINPLMNVGLGVALLGETLTRVQWTALGLGAAAVAVLTAGYGRVPWVALILATSFAVYGFLKKAVGVEATAALAVETAVILPLALAAMAMIHSRGDAAFTNGPVGRDVLLVSLGVITAVPLLLFGVAATRVPLSFLGLLQYLAPTIQLLCGVVAFHEPLPPERLAGFMLVWVALLVLAGDALRSSRRRAAGVPVAEPA